MQFYPKYKPIVYRALYRAVYIAIYAVFTLLEPRLKFQSSCVFTGVFIHIRKYTGIYTLDLGFPMYLTTLIQCILRYVIYNGYVII